MFRINRRKLLVKACNTEFAFLVEQYKFRRIMATDGVVQYVSSDRQCYIAIIFERPIELTVVFSRQNIVPSALFLARSWTTPLAPGYDPQVTLRLHDAGCAFVSDHVEGTFEHISDEGDIPPAVARLAARTKQYAGPILRRDPDAFDRAFEDQRIRSRDYTKRILLKSLPVEIAAQFDSKSLEEVDAAVTEYRTRRKQS